MAVREVVCLVLPAPFCCLCSYTMDPALGLSYPCHKRESKVGSDTQRRRYDSWDRSGKLDAGSRRVEKRTRLRHERGRHRKRLESVTPEQGNMRRMRLETETVNYRDSELTN